jgi:hypothetical protein
VLKLLRGQEVPKAFVAARKTASKTQIAVAFWGNGAVAKLGLNRGAKVDIVCNALHPGCNPEVILALVKKGHRVKTNDQLHAKMYLTDSKAIIGSSNVSTNGLNEEGSASAVWLEANVLTDDPKLVKSAAARFAEYWRKSRFIKAPELKRLTAARKDQPPRPRFLSTTSLIDACREDPALFKNVGFLMWSGPLSKEGKAALKQWKAEVKPARGSDVTVDDIRRADSYEFSDDVGAGWYFSWKVPEVGEPRYEGLVRIDFKIKQEDVFQYFGFRRREIQLPNGQTIKMTKGDREFLLKHIGRISDKFDGGAVMLSDVVKFLDRPRRGRTS